MRATGIVRRVDVLGRILIPKEIRNKIGISEGTPMELYITGDGILLKKYLPGIDFSEQVQSLSDVFCDIREDMEADVSKEIESHIRALKDILKQSRAGNQ